MSKMLLTYRRIVSVAFLLTLFFFTVSSNLTFGQTTSATGSNPMNGAINCGLDCLGSGVTNASYAAEGHFSSTLKAVMVSEKSVLGVSGGAAFLTLRFPSNVPAQSAVYVKVDSPQATGFSAGAAGISSFAGTNITATLQSAASSVSDGSAINASIQFVADYSNQLFMVITPNGSNTTPFNAVRIVVDAPALNVPSTLSLNVYFAFYYTENYACGRPNYISVGEATGLNAGVSANPFTNPPNVIFDFRLTQRTQMGFGLTTNDFSKLSRIIYYDCPNPDYFQTFAYLSFGIKIDDESLFNGLTIQQFLGNNPTSPPIPLESIINLDSLGYSEGVPANTILSFSSFSPSKYDRVVITLSNTIDETLLSGGIFLHSIHSFPQKPKLTPEVAYQFNSKYSILTAESTGAIIAWRDSEEYGESNSGQQQSPAIFGFMVDSNRDFWLSAVTGCGNDYLAQTSKYSIVILKDESTALSDGIKGKVLASGGSMKASSPDHPFNYTITGLPTGLSFDNSTGAITGTPTQAGTFNLSVSIFDGIRDTGLKLTKNLLIYDILEIAGGAFPKANVNTNSYSKSLRTDVDLAATGGKGSLYYAYSLSPILGSGRISAPLAVPTGFTLSPLGVLSGDPSVVDVGEYTFKIYVTDGLQETSSDFTITVADEPLPVIISAFTAKKEGLTTILDWTTTAEINSDRFEIERSNDARNWEMIGFRKSIGSTSASVSYSFVDNKPESGANIYRLKMIDTDGTFAFSKKLSVNFDDNQSVYIYPNPLGSVGELKLAGLATGEISSILVSNMGGKKLADCKNIEAATEFIKHLEPGLYLIEITKKQGPVYSQKFIKQ